MARQRGGNPSGSGGRSGGRRGGGNDASTPFSSSSFSGGNTGKPRRRPLPASSSGAAPAGPQGLHDVYDFAQASTSASSKQSRGARRAMAGMSSNDYADLPSKAKGKSSHRRRGDDDDDEDEDEDSDESDGPVGPKVFDSDDELNAGIEGSDEELDSDEAFGESDEEKFDGWTFGRGKKQQSKRKGDGSDDDEDEDEEDDGGDDGGMMDLSRMLDSASSSSENEEDEDEDDSDDDDEDNDANSSKLAKHIESFAAGSKRAAATGSQSGSDNEAPSSKRTRRVLSERTEAVPETEFAPSHSTSLRLEDFMNPLSSNVDFADVRKSTKVLAQNKSSSSSNSAPLASKKGGGALSAPLPTVVQDRLDRQGAYSTTRDEVSGWQPTINRLRAAEHLSFPLQSPAVTKASTSGLVATFTPDNEMESSIAAMLTEGGLTEAQLAQQEDLAMNKLDPAEARARRDELRRMRMLMFRAEQKAKRVSKIKSKAYRKIARKEKEKLKAQMKELGSDAEDDVELGSDAEMEERMKAERDRARERATLKHKNTSKWAKNILSARHGEHTQEARNELDAQLRRGAELRAKIDARDDLSDGDSDDYSDDGDERNDREVVGDAFDELEALEAKEEAKRRKDEEEFERVGGKKGVYGMKFMKDARERQYQKIRGDVDDFVTEMQGIGAQEDAGSDGDSEDQGETVIARKSGKGDEGEGGSSTYVQGNKGRAMYGASSSSTVSAPVTTPKKAVEAPTGKTEPASSAKAQAAPNSGLEIGGEATITKAMPKPSRASKPSLSSTDPAAHDDDDDEANPWLAVASNGTTSRLSRKKNDSTLSNNSTSAAQASKSALRASKSASKSASSLAAKRDDEAIAIDLTSRLQSQHDNDSEDSDGDAIQPSNVVRNLTKKQKKSGTANGGPITALQQRDLVSSAFAGDDVVSEFAAEKEATVLADESKTIDTRLPGWGSWTGKGIRAPNPNKPTNPKYLKKIQGVDRDKRKDAKLANVIITERRDKKQDKFTVRDLPYPYTSVAQYKAAMQQPLGKEWNTRIETQRLNMPKVMKKPGKVITPVVRKF